MLHRDGMQGCEVGAQTAACRCLHSLMCSLWRPAASLGLLESCAAGCTLMSSALILKDWGTLLTAMSGKSFPGCRWAGYTPLFWPRHYLTSTLAPTLSPLMPRRASAAALLSLPSLHDRFSLTQCPKTERVDRYQESGVSVAIKCSKTLISQWTTENVRNEMLRDHCQLSWWS